MREEMAAAETPLQKDVTVWIWDEKDPQQPQK